MAPRRSVDQSRAGAEQREFEKFFETALEAKRSISNSSGVGRLFGSDSHEATALRGAS
jgi:hypothetical protein